MRTMIAAAVAVMLAGAAGAKAQLWGDWTADNLRTGCAPIALEIALAGKAKGDDVLRGASGECRRVTPPRRRSLHRTAIRSMARPRRPRDGAGRAEHAIGRERSGEVFSRHPGHRLWSVGTVIVWESAFIISYSDVREAVAELLDRFLTAYLRANPECGR